MDIRQKKEYLDTFPLQVLLAVGAPEVTFYNTPTGYQALCPFHNDAHLGSFIFNPYTGVWKCFSCGEGGRGAYKFLMKLKNWSFVETVSYLYDNKDTPVSPFETTIPTALMSHGKSALFPFNKPASNSRKPVSLPAVSQKENFLHQSTISAEDVSRIYKTFAAASPLTPVEESKLQAKRDLMRFSLKDFFRFPSNSDEGFWRTFRQMLQMYDDNPGEERLYHSLIGVSGFYWDEWEDKPAFVSLKGSLGILSHSADGLVNGIELRTKARDGEPSRYIGFSSAAVCARNPERCVLGTKSDTIVDVNFRSLREEKGIAITEGKFKAIHLSYKGYTALNVRGIGNWQKVLPVLANLPNNHCVTIVFDADMRKNPAVAKAASALARQLMSDGYEVQFLTWPARYGKGFDDLCSAGWYSKAITVPSDRYLKTTLDPFLERAKKYQKQAPA